jgi:SAP domain
VDKEFLSLTSFPENPPDPVQREMRRLNTWTIPILKDMLREKGLKISGSKAELIRRIVDSS